MTKEEQLNKQIDHITDNVLVLNNQFWVNVERIRNTGTIEEKELWLKVVRGLIG